MKLHTIDWVKPLSSGQMQVAFEGDNSWPIIDLSPILAQGGVFTPLADYKQFAAVERAADGRSLYWRTGPGEDDIVDLCADALWLMAHPEDRAAMFETEPAGANEAGHNSR